MISGILTSKDREEAAFFNSIIKVGLLNMDYSEKEKFKDTKIRIKVEWDNEESK